MKTITKRLSLATLCSAAVLLAACGSEDQTVGQKVFGDQRIARPDE